MNIRYLKEKPIQLCKTHVDFIYFENFICYGEPKVHFIYEPDFYQIFPTLVDLKEILLLFSFLRFKFPFADFETAAWHMKTRGFFLKKLTPFVLNSHTV